MKITINFDNEEFCKDYYGTWFCASKEEWDNFQHSRAYRDKYWKSGTYLTTSNNEPQKFPCIAIHGGVIYRSDSYDEEIYTFIYDFKVEE